MIAKHQFQLSYVKRWSVSAEKVKVCWAGVATFIFSQSICHIAFSTTKIEYIVSFSDWNVHCALGFQSIIDDVTAIHCGMDSISIGIAP